MLINRNKFNRASREFDYFFHHKIDEDIKRTDKTFCKACGSEPLAAHKDGNMKLHRFVAAKGYCLFLIALESLPI